MVKECDQVWLLGAPEGVAESLKEAGITTPKYVLLTSLRSPGLSDLGSVVTFKEDPLRIGGLAAVPVASKHGTDYAIRTSDASLLFSERGDVSSREMVGYDLCVIKNKHRGDDWGSNVITWPWPDAEYSITDHTLEPVVVETVFKVYSKLSDVPDNMKTMDGVPLSLSQVNWIVRVAEGIPEGEVDSPWAVAKGMFKKNFHIENEKWVKNKRGQSEKALPELQESEDVEPVMLDLSEVNYRMADDSAYSCGNCGHYLNGMCYLVDSAVGRNYTCDMYVPVKRVMLTKEDTGLALKELLPLSNRDRSWDAKAAEARIRKWAGGPSKDDIDWSKYGRGFLIKLDSDATKFGDFKLPYADIIDGSLVAVPQGIIAAAQVIQGARGGVDAPADKINQAKAIISRYYAKMREEFDDFDREVPWESKEKEYSISDVIGSFMADVPDVPTSAVGGWSTVYKSEDGQWHWASITSSAVWDRQGELVSPEAMEWAVKVARVIGPGPLRFKHAPGLDGGVCTAQAAVGGYLFEKGDFDDTPIGQAMRRLMQNDPTWQISPGLLFGPKDLDNGRYKRVVVFERSMTKVPANPVTAILTSGGITMKQLSEDELAQVAKDLGLDVEYVRKLHQQALKNGGRGITAAGLKEMLKEDKPEEEEKVVIIEEEPEQEQLEKAKELLAKLSGRQRSMLKEVLDELEAPEDTIRKELSQLKELVSDQSRQLERLVGFVAARSDAASAGKDAVAGFLSNLPRRQQAQFASKELGTKPDETDEQILSLLREIKKEVLAQQNPFGPGGDIYSHFTSRRLNPQRGAER